MLHKSIPSSNHSNSLIVTGLRPGVEKINFVQTSYDSLLGQAFISVTNVYTDVVLSNYTRVNQEVQRVVTAPDILFAAQDIGVGAGFPAPVLWSRGTTFVNNDAINGNTPHAGPGVVTPPIRITFSDILPGWLNDADNPIGPEGAIRTEVWGSFDASMDTPIIIYPDWLSLQELESMIVNE